MRRYELVRVSAELLKQLLAEESPPVVLVGMKRYGDGTLELIFRTPDEQSKGHES